MSIRQLVEEVPQGCRLPSFDQKPVTLALQEGETWEGSRREGGETPAPTPIMQRVPILPGLPPSP